MTAYFLSGLQLQSKKAIAKPYCKILDHDTDSYKMKASANQRQRKGTEEYKLITVFMRNHDFIEKITEHTVHYHQQHCLLFYFVMEKNYFSETSILGSKNIVA